MHLARSTDPATPASADQPVLNQPAGVAGGGHGDARRGPVHSTGAGACRQGLSTSEGALISGNSIRGKGREAIDAIGRFVSDPSGPRRSKARRMLWTTTPETAPGTPRVTPERPRASATHPSRRPDQDRGGRRSSSTLRRPALLKNPDTLTEDQAATGLVLHLNEEPARTRPSHFHSDT